MPQELGMLTLWLRGGPCNRRIQEFGWCEFLGDLSRVRGIVGTLLAVFWIWGCVLQFSS